jgi:hypothetical protein
MREFSCGKKLRDGNISGKNFAYAWFHKFAGVSR